MNDIKDIIGVIFDFNGTMFFDSKKHLEAWTRYAEELIGRSLTDDEIKKHVNGKSGRYVVEHFLGYTISDDMYEQLSEEKESIYRRLCSEDKASLKLADGLEEFLDFLAEHNIPRTLATMAPPSNIMYYFETFDLYRWFEPDKIVCHNKRLRDKPFPDLYLVACKLIDKEPARCLVFEDSDVGIMAATNAGIKHIVAVTGDNKNSDLSQFNNINAVISDFTQLNKELEL